MTAGSAIEFNDNGNKATADREAELKIVGTKGGFVILAHIDSEGYPVIDIVPEDCPEGAEITYSESVEYPTGKEREMVLSHEKQVRISIR